MPQVIVLEDGTTIVPYNSDRTGAQMDRAMDRGDSVGDISQLTTTNKSSVVGAINEINSNIGVVVPEVAAARVGADGTSYQTLKERLDSEYSENANNLITAQTSNRIDIEALENEIFETITNKFAWKNGEYGATGFINASYQICAKVKAGTYTITPSDGYVWKAFKYVSDTEGVQIWSDQSVERTYTFTDDFYLTVSALSHEAITNTYAVGNTAVRVTSTGHSNVLMPKIQELIDDATKTEYSNSEYIAEAFSEVYIENGDGTESFATIEISSSKTKISIKSGSDIVCFYNADSRQTGILIIPEYNQSGVSAIVVINPDVDINVSGTFNLLPAAYISTKSPIISEYLYDTLEGRVEALEPEPYTNTIYVDRVEPSVLKGLYIPDETYKFYSISATATGYRLGFKTNDGNDRIIIAGYDVAPEFYSDKVQKLVDKDTGDVIAYYVLHYTGTDYAIQFNSGIAINETAYSLDSNAIINDYLSRPENLVLIGDSIFGLNTVNILEGYLGKISNKQVFNCGFGGCRMSYRTAAGSDPYDNLTFVAIADAIASGDYSVVESSALGNLDNAYPLRVASLKEVDWTRPTTIFVDYCNNDITGNAPIGDKWEYTDTLQNFDKTSLLGATNYGICRILTQYPHIRIVVFTEAWRNKTDRDGNSVPPYAYVNSLGLTSKQYNDAIIENANRQGISVYDFINNGGRNFYNTAFYQVDASHYNQNGYAKFAKLLDALDKSYIQ